MFVRIVKSFTDSLVTLEAQIQALNSQMQCVRELV